MGNSSSREARSSQDRPSGQGEPRSPNNPIFSFSMNPPPNDRSSTLYSSRAGRGSRRELEFLGINGMGDIDPTAHRGETKQEKEARKLEKERLLRGRERDRSMREEGVDGGYLVTLGTYVGPEDFSKVVVRQLQLERRLAPFWRGLNDHSDSWTEHQLVAAARGLPIPPPDEIPPQDSESPSPTEERRTTTASIPNTSKPVPPPPTASSDDSPSVPGSPNTSHIAFSPPGAAPSLSPGRTKPVSGLSSGREASPPSIFRQEIQLPKERQINGQPLEAYLYKDVCECPICFLYYPPYLNRTRCCDQHICSECFVQIKRPDPHPPEHNDPDTTPSENNQLRQWESEGQLVSEPATCPFCKMPELGITYDPPPFRRGLAYANDGAPSSSRNTASNPSKRTRGQSMSTSHPNVVLTDVVRPDWAMKLHDARKRADRRSRAATALHQAAYGDQPGGIIPERIRRAFHAEGGEGSSNGPSQRLQQMSPAQFDQLIASALAENSTRSSARRGNGDLFPSRMSSRNTRIEDVEEYMMMRAIQESLAAEEDRKKKEEKEAEKERKKEDKRRAKEQKKADKAAKKGGGSYPSSANNSRFFSAGQSEQGSSADGKGKGRASGSPEGHGRGGYQPGGFNPLEEPTSTLNSETSANQQKLDSAQKHLEQSRANLSSDVFGQQQSLGLPHFGSFTSSRESSFVDNGSHQPSLPDSRTSPNASGQHLPPISTSDGSNGNESSFNSLAAMMGAEDGNSNKSPTHQQKGEDRTGRSRGASSSSQNAPPKYQFGNQTDHGYGGDDGVDTKHGGNVAVVGRTESA